MHVGADDANEHDRCRRCRSAHRAARHPHGRPCACSRGKTGFTLTSFIGALMLPPTLTGVGFGAPGVGCVAGSRLALTVTVSDSLPTCRVMARSQSEAFVSSNSWRNALNPGERRLEHVLHAGGGRQLESARGVGRRLRLRGLRAGQRHRDARQDGAAAGRRWCRSAAWSEPVRHETRRRRTWRERARWSRRRARGTKAHGDCGQNSAWRRFSSRELTDGPSAQPPPIRKSTIFQPWRAAAGGRHRLAPRLRSPGPRRRTPVRSRAAACGTRSTSGAGTSRPAGRCRRQSARPSRSGARARARDTPPRE